MNLTKIPVTKIVPDPEQPRKYFDEAKMGTLRKSIEHFGIKEPLTLEIQKDGTYLIIDGERRFRVAKELGMKEVPAILESEQNQVQRLIEQFHLQEMHEGWTGIEKAMAVSKLASEMSISQMEMAKLLGIPDRTISTYISFGHIVDKKNFQRSVISLETAKSINGLKAAIKRICEANEFEYDRNTAKAIENAVFARVREGENPSPNFFTRIKDSINQHPEMLKRFLEDDKLTVDKMYSESKAKGAHYLRTIFLNNNYLRLSINGYLKEKSVKFPKERLAELKTTKTVLSDFINQFDD